jgi:activating signal cointegrator complex subunit 3
MSVGVQPITRTGLRVELTIRTDFEWSDRVHGFAEPWWIWVQDAEVEKVYYTELYQITKLQKDIEHKIFFTIPIADPPPPQYFIYAESDRWIGASAVCEMNFRSLLLPQRHAKHTDLLNIQPLPIAALGNPEFESLYRMSHFNAIQTQIFHCMYHTNNNALIGAPTGSGKTICGELAMMRTFKNYPSTKIVYIAPLKAIVRERMLDWDVRLTKIGKYAVELTGDSQSDMRMLSRADVIVTTPEKWDGVSRAWATRDYVKQVSLVIMDEIHLLGGDRGPILEVIVSRMRYIASQRNMKLRFVGLSTALANARDLADWLGIDTVGLYNFKPSVRPVPLECHIAGYPGKHYCPRMQTMNRPTFLAIMEHSRQKPALVFVSSRRQTRLTALDLISYSEATDFYPTEDHPRQFLRMSHEELDMLMTKVDDKNLKHTLSFGIGLHHAGLNANDKSICEELFAHNKIQVLVSTSTLAWGVNLPAHLVVVKGTEFFDAKTKRYVDYPITDVLQMMGRAGRPQFDRHAKAVRFYSVGQTSRPVQPNT